MSQARHVSLSGLVIWEFCGYRTRLGNWDIADLIEGFCQAKLWTCSGFLLVRGLGGGRIIVSNVHTIEDNV